MGFWESSAHGRVIPCHIGYPMSPSGVKQDMAMEDLCNLGSLPLTSAMTHIGRHMGLCIVQFAAVGTC